MITYTDVSIGVGKKKILSDISCHINDRELTCIIGPNGSGKSTLIKSIAKLNKVFGGTIIVNGKEISDYTIKEYAKIVTYLPQNTKGFKKTTVKELMLCAKYQNKKLFETINESDMKEIDIYLKRFNIKNLESRYISSLSGGEKQRVYIAFALCQEPKILLLDEPTTYLDIAYQKDLLEIIKTLKHEMAIVMVIHDINQTLKYSDHVIVLKEGRLYKEGDISIIDEDLLKKVYDVDAKYLENEKTFVF